MCFSAGRFQLTDADLKIKEPIIAENHEIEKTDKAPLHLETLPAKQGDMSATSRFLLPAPEPIPESPMLMRAIYPLGVSRRGWQRTLFYSIFILAVCFFVWRVQSVLPPFLFAIFLAALLDPTLRYMESKGRSRVQSILLIYLLGLLGVIIVVILVFPAARNQIEDLSQNFNAYSDSVRKSANLWIFTHKNFLKFFGIQQNNFDAIINSSSSPIQGKIAEALGGVTAFVQGLPSQAIWLILPVISFFIMQDYPTIRARTIALFPAKMHNSIDEVTKEIVDVFSAYIQGLTKICSLYGVIIFIILWILGLKYALFLGILAGIFYVIPLIGPYIVALAAAILAYIEPHTVLFAIHVSPNSFVFALIVALAIVVTQISFDQIVYPRIVGGSVGLHPVISIFALLCGANLLGIVGMIIAVPFAGSLQILLKYLFPQIARSAPEHLLKPKAT